MSLHHSILPVLSLCAMTLASMTANASEPRLDRVQIRRTLIEAPNGTDTGATALNNAGVVVGVYNSPQARAFAWTRRGGFVDLEGAVESGFSIAWDVNECGQVVGELNNHAVLWNTFEEIEHLGTLGGSVSSAHAINDRGDVVGSSQIMTGGRSGPFLWTETDGMQPIECPGENGGARAINNAREVVGVCDDTLLRPHAFYWSEATGRVDFPESSRYQSTFAHAINDRGEVVVSATIAEPTFGFETLKWMPRTQRIVKLREFGNLFDLPDDINRFGWVVGAAVYPPEVRRAVVWLRPRVGFLIDPSLGTDSSAFGINDVGSIVGTVSLGSGGRRAVLWEPPTLVKRALRKKGIGQCLRR